MAQAPASGTGSPLVSVIVRSMDRPSLASALDAAARQDYPSLEIVLVAANGAAHAPPPARAGAHPIRFVPGTEPLSRPRAANAGLDAARGEWITFLDDDDTLVPGHVSGLVAAAGNARGARLVYTLARARMSDGRSERWGQPFALAELYERNFIHLSTALFSHELVTLGCRFDETLDIMQDWDFFLQCAQRTPFHFEPRQTFEWHADAGSSGAGAGANQDDARFAAYRDRIYAKWETARDALVDRVRADLERAVARLRDGDHAGAEAATRHVLGYGGNDPHALNLLALVLRSTGRLAEAREAQEIACAVRPDDGSLIYNLALLCRAQGDVEAARTQCRRAVRAAPAFAPAQRLLAELGG